MTISTANTLRAMAMLHILSFCWLLVAFAPNLAFGQAQEQEPAKPKLEQEGGQPAAEPLPREQNETWMRANRGDIVQIGRDITIGQNESCDDLVVIGGNAKIDGKAREVVVIGGTAEINGTVSRCVVSVLGGLKMGKDAHVGHEVVVVGGPMQIDDTATIGRERVFVPFGTLTVGVKHIQEWLMHGLILARPLPPQFPWVWIVAGFFALFYLGLAYLFPKPVLASVDALRLRPVGSFFSGILLLILFGPLLFILFVSVIGWIAIPFVFCAMAVAFLFGRVAVYSFVGQQITRQMDGLERKLPLLLLAGVVLFYLLYMVPVLGFVVWALAAVLGLGAVTLAAFGSFSRERAPGHASPPAVLVTNVATVAGNQPIPPALPGSDVIVMQRVGFWLRFVATALDLVLLSLILAFTGPVFLAVWCAYYVLMWGWKGTSIGGIVLGIKVVRLNGAPVDFAVALVRSLASCFSALPLFLGFFWAGWDPEKQAWHDKIAGTLVVRVPKGMSLI